MKLIGTHSLSSPSHISLLLYKTFNVSIPISHIPSEQYQFNPSLPSSKREFSPFSDEEDDSDSERGTEDGEVEMGRWVDKRTGKVVGDDEGVLFTVVR
jgi:DNA-directed RNA polymerase I subunit RPA43